jgi:hypothetical protein
MTAGGEAAVIELGDGEVRTRVGRATEPDLVLDGPPRAVLGLLNGLIGVEVAEQLGLVATGRRELLGRLRPIASVDAEGDGDQP